MAGLFTGTYALSLLSYLGFGKLSRLRLVNGSSPQPKFVPPIILNL